ncbi:MAG: hypothetical protein GXP28_10970 [Planctomycetes bacterium]|nr:hypothetical protein [Planctomycetota bacterium]
MGGKLFLLLLCGMLVGLSGCSLVLPEISHQPVIRNPFPQLSRVAVAPFFNHSDEPTVDGREVAMAYFAELQRTPGFEVVPVGVVEEAIIANRVDLRGPGEARRLAELLGVDVVVVGSVTDYSPYYPPRCGLRVEWYTANPGYHEIPAGYGLPWNTPEEEYIPDSLVYESEMALARAQMATQTPDCDSACRSLPSPPAMPDRAGNSERPLDPFEDRAVRLAQAEELPAGDLQPTPADDQVDTNGLNESNETNESILAGETIGATGALPSNLPDKNCFTPPSLHAGKPACVPFHGPVLSHTRIYRGTDPELTGALKSYVYFREDARFGGWEAYLQRSDDFLRFCCHMHISEMLAARGGSHKTRLVWRWPESR